MSKPDIMRVLRGVTETLLGHAEVASDDPLMHAGVDSLASVEFRNLLK